MAKSRKKKPMVYEKPRLIQLGSNDVAEGQYCTPGGGWPDECITGGDWSPECVTGGQWNPECVTGGAWSCITGGAWSPEICVEGLANMYDCAMGDGFGGGDCLEFGQMFQPD